MKGKIKEIIRKLLMVVSIIAIFYSGYQLYLIKQDKDNAKQVNKEIIEIIGKEDDELKFLTKKSFAELNEINDEFIGYFDYPSLGISEPVTQTTNNDFYLDRSIYKDYLMYGTIFKSFDQTKDDQNWTLYGHWIQNSSAKFSSLHHLMDEANYEENKKFYYSDDEYVYEYDVAYVIYHSEVSKSDNVPYWQGSFSESEFNDFVLNAEKQALYSTGVEVNYSDKLMSLQTCIRYDSDERLVVVGKEVSRTPIADE